MRPRSSCREGGRPSPGPVDLRDVSRVLWRKCMQQTSGEKGFTSLFLQQLTVGDGNQLVPEPAAFPCRILNVATEDVWACRCYMGPFPHVQLHLPLRRAATTIIRRPRAARLFAPVKGTAPERQAQIPPCYEPCGWSGDRASLGQHLPPHVWPFPSWLVSQTSSDKRGE